GYNGALAAATKRLGEVFTYKCLPMALPVAGDDRTVDHLVEVRPSLDPCYCDASQGRLDPDPSITDHLPAIYQTLSDDGYDPNATCLCEIAQLEGAALADCYAS